MNGSRAARTGWAAIKSQWRIFAALSVLERAAVVLFLAGALVVPVWHWWARSKQLEMQILYDSAMTGNTQSVRKIANHRLANSTEWLEKLADDRNADAYARVAALDALMEKPSVDPRSIVPLLWIQVPFVVRHEAAQLLLKRGCGDECVRMTLDCLHSISGGRSTLEMRLGAEHKDRDADSDRLAQELRNTTESDYFALLRSNACTSRRYLISDYSRDHDFSEKVQHQLSDSCTG